MSSQLKNKEFRELQKLWYQKLKAKGFHDIEKSEDRLALYESAYFSDTRRMTSEVMEARQAYYRIAGQFLHDHVFKNSFERKVWGWHSEGLPIRDIAAKFKRPGWKDKIHLTLNRLEQHMINKTKGKR